MCVVKFCLKNKGRHKKVTSLEINHTKGILYYSAKYVFIFPDDEAFFLGDYERHDDHERAAATKRGRF